MTEENENITYDLEERSIDFAVWIIHMAECLPKTKVANHIAGQLIRCGTSPAPNYGEAQSAESRIDSSLRVFLKLEWSDSTLRHSIFDILLLCGSLFIPSILMGTISHNSAQDFIVP